MIDIDWKPSDRKLRQFAMASLFGFPLIGLLLTRLISTLGTETLVIAAIIGAVICVLGLIFPKCAFPVYIAMFALALPIGIALGFILLPLIYYVIFTPIALGLRVLGRDPMSRSLAPIEGSYWIKRKPTPTSSHYYKQY